MVQGEDTSSDGSAGSGAAITTRLLRAIRVAVVTDSLDELITALATDSPGSTDGDTSEVDEPAADTVMSVIRALEELKNAISARQADLAVNCYAAQRDRDRALNLTMPRARQLDESDTARVIGAQLGLARRTSPQRGTHLLRLAHRLHDDLPHTYEALQAGRISEWQAQLVTREACHLDHEHTTAVDEALTPLLGHVSDQHLQDRARELVLTLDPEAATAARQLAENGRHVTLRRAPESMTRLSALLPMADGLQLMTALTGAAQTVEASRHDRPKDRRTRGQLMADTLVTAVTGHPAALAPEFPAASRTDDPADCPAPVTVNLLVPLGTLTGHTPAHLEGFGPIPADLARDLIATAGERVRRIFAHPDTGQLIAMESRARHYPGLLATFIKLRDRRCRTPHCGAPITQIDHIRAHHAGGPTTADNGQGVCTTCNLVKEHPDYAVTGDSRRTTTSTGGLSVDSTPPAPPGDPVITLPTHPERERGNQRRSGCGRAIYDGPGPQDGTMAAGYRALGIP